MRVLITYLITIHQVWGFMAESFVSAFLQRCNVAYI